MLWLILGALALGCFSTMSKEYKTYFVIFVVIVGIFIGSIAGNASMSEALTGLSLIYGCVGLLIVGGVLGITREQSSNQSEYVANRTKIISFIFKYGFVFWLTSFTLKALIFLAGGSFTVDAWDGANLLITLTPIKLIAFIIVVAIYHKLKKEGKFKSGLTKTLQSRIYEILDSAKTYTPSQPPKRNKQPPKKTTDWDY